MWQVRANFRPEFVNRIDEYIVFEGLKREQIKKIVRIQAKRVAERLAAKKVSLDLSESAVDYLVVSVDTSWCLEVPFFNIPIPWDIIRNYGKLHILYHIRVK